MSEYTPKAKELSIKTRRDDALIVGSEIRNALQEQQDRIEQLEAALGDCVDYFDGCQVNGIDDKDDAATYAAEAGRKALAALETDNHGIVDESLDTGETDE